MVLGSSPVAVTSPSDFAPASSKKFLDIQATIECRFTLKRVRDMTRTYSYNTKITELENKIPDISNVTTKITLIAIENKIPSVSNLVTKIDYNTKIIDIENKLNNHNHDKYIDTSEFNKSASDVFNVRLAQANLITKTDFDTKLSSLNRKITQNKSKHLLVENELNKLKTFDSSYFTGKSHFGEDGTQNCLVFQPMYRYFKTITNTDYISSWKSKGLLNHLQHLIIVLLQY